MYFLPIQNRQLFSCAPGKGVFVPYSHVIPDPRFTESLPPPVLGQDFGPLDSPVVPGFCAPHTAVDGQERVVVSVSVSAWWLLNSYMMTLSVFRLYQIIAKQ